MENETITNRYTGNIALRTIPASIKENTPEVLTDKGIDEIKIIELASAIDRWEQEVLFDSAEKGGFYSLTGREVENQSKEYIKELTDFIDVKISEMSFVLPSSREQAYKIKDAKVASIKEKMDLYSQEQLGIWVLNTCEEALNTTVARAVFYKNDPSVIETAFVNGLKIIEIIAKKENWNTKLHNYRKKQFVSDFYTTLINEFINDKDVTAYQYFNKYKEVIEDKEKEKLEKLTDKMRIDVIANNWSHEIFSYELDEKTFEKELNKIEDNDIKTAARQFYFDLKKSEKRKKLQEEKEKNIRNWKEVIEAANENINKAALYIDYSLKTENINSKKEYIKQKREFGTVKTLADDFLKLFNEIFNGFQIFSDMDISDYQSKLSDTDFSIFSTIQDNTYSEFITVEYDLKYILSLFDETNITNEEKCNFIRMYFSFINEYKTEKKLNADYETRQKIIDLIFKRFDKKIKKG